MPTWSTWVAVAGGGAIGTVLRVACSRWFAVAAPSAFPWGTLAVNLAGSALLGWLTGALPSRTTSPALVAALTAGLCGGFTTMSTFAIDTVQLASSGALTRAVLYVVATTVGSVLLAALGYVLARPLPT
ncbi:MAG: CrcB family protein [Gemmatimonadaceae bacterium]|nr:CrcB family protein [Gemmatimonadaceae bacterium]